MRTTIRLPILAILLSCAAAAWAEPKVEVFTPQGEAKGVRQVAVRFSEPMVEFGDPRLADPFTWKCEGDAEVFKGKGRWADGRNWIFDFDGDLPAGQRCRFSLKGDAKSAAGVATTGKRDFDFHTGGPTVVTSLPEEGNENIDEDQSFVFVFDAPIDARTLDQAWCEAAGVNERIPVQALPQDEARKILAAQPYQAYRFYRLVYKGRKPVTLAQFRVEDKRFRDMPVVGLRCARKLPAGAKISVVIGAGVKTRTGIPRASAQRLAFKVRPAFTIAFSCQRVNKDAQCLPATPMTVNFTAPISRESAAAFRLKAASGKAWPATLEPNVKTVESLTFQGPFPEEAKFTIELPKDLRDDSGRTPSNVAMFPLEVRTDRFPPLVKVPGRFGILETADATLPVTVRGVEPSIAGKKADVSPIPGSTTRVEGDETQIIKRYFSFMTPPEERARRPKKGEKLEPIRPGELSSLEASDSAAPFALPRPVKGRAMEVIGIPFKKPGFYLVELASPRLGEALHGEKGMPYYVATSVLVTNLAVHLKHGKESSLVWVTKLSDGSPVAGARVSVRNCRGERFFEGRTDGDGIAAIDKALPPVRGYPPCPLVAFAQVGDDLSFTLSSWREGIEPWNYGANTGYWNTSPLAIHTIFDRTLFRAGEKVSMKHVARIPTGDGFRIPKEGTLPTKATLYHTDSDQSIALTVKFDARGFAESEWAIPKEAKLGTYQLQWTHPTGVRSSAEFRVEAFRVPLMRATLAAPKEALVKPKSAKIDAAITYLAGGPAAYLPVRVRHRVEPRMVSFDDYPDFGFSGQPVKEGVTTGPAMESYDLYDPDEEGGTPERGANDAPVTTRAFTLDAAGTAALVIDKLPAIERPSSLAVEVEYDDPNGEKLAASTRVALHAAGLYVGIRPDGWAATKAGVNAQVLVLDTAGKPVAGRAVTIDVFERKTYSSRRRVLGGFYAYDSVTETRKVGSGCSGTSDARGLVFCAVKPGLTGEVILRAQAQDDGKRIASATASVWVVGDGEWWFDPSSNDRMDLVAEKKRYEPGETARLQVRMPFRSATVLVTVEREGVLDRRIVKLDAKSPVIEVPMKGTYGPNVFVSALAVRGRVPSGEAKPPTALLDLAKPAYKLGMTSIKVGRRDYELKVKVAPDRDTFKVREKAHVAIEVTDSSGKPAANGEIALAAVDEGLLELMDNASWNILDALLGDRPIEVVTATAQGHVIGKRHFGRKSVPAGGGGGKSGARELFDTLLAWKGRVTLDAQGKASIDIPLNDSLSSFRIVAVATSGAAKFGTGKATIRTTQDLMLFAGLPPVVREQDDFTAMFTLRNTTAAPIDSRVTWSVSKVINGEQRVTLAANESKVISVPVKVPVNFTKLQWEVSATAQGGAKDTLRATQEVIEVHPVRVYQATLARLDKPVVFPATRPSDAIPGRGGVRVEVLPTLSTDMSPLREWFRYYVYSCLEQRASKAIGLRDDGMWSRVAESVPSYLDRDGLARYFPTEALEGSDVLTAYLIQVADADEREYPEATRDRMLNGLEGFATGRVVRGSALPTADLAIRKLAAIEALSRHDRAKPEMLQSIDIDAPRWPTSAVLDWIGILQRVKGIPDAAKKRSEALNILRSRMNFQGTVMTFSTEKADALWWLMAGADVNANRAILAVLDEPEWQEDMGRVVRGALSRQLRGAWSTTIANAWGIAALDRYADKFEAKRAIGTMRIALGREKVDVEVDTERRAADLPWPEGRGNLTLAYEGEGAPWAIIQSRAALPLKEAISTGYHIKRTVKPVDSKESGSFTRGDVYRVTLEIEAQSDMTWVVVDDPIPSGAAVLGSGLGRDAGLLTRGEKREGGAWPAFVERGYTSYRAYYWFVPKGRFVAEYTVRLNNAGRFDLPATRVEAMYAPEMLGELPNVPVVVKP
ncbi:hypothetical protein BWI17_18335 [Betaproteobacteria bacterium GR16-43]|nr:hypothetical protein BWI17_18335 [Betaproteobacteria bacterium GR16-43]